MIQNNTNIIKNCILFVFAAVLAGVIAYVFKTGMITKFDEYSLPGRPLAAFTDIYPIDISNSGKLSLNNNKFASAVKYLLEENNPKAASELMYMGQANNINLLLDNEQKQEYSKLIKKYDYIDLTTINQNKNEVFQTYKDIVNGIGLTFQGTGIEIVLHDVRNPLKSIVAVQNPILGRKIGDPNTNFGMELIKDYSIIEKHGESYISYGLELSDGRKIKSSTIPVYDNRFGLIGFICMNIEISKMSVENSEYIASFIESLSKIKPNNKINELIEHTKG